MARQDRTVLAKRIKARRLELGLTQREVAGSDFTRGFVSQIENGIIDPSLKSLEIIAQRLGVPVSEFLTQANTVDPVLVEDQIRQANSLLKTDPETAASIASNAYESAQELNNAWLLARAQSARAWAAYYADDFPAAADLFKDAADCYRRAGNLIQASRALNSAGAAAHRANDFARATALYEAALECLHNLDEPSPLDYLRAQVNLGLLLASAGESKRSIHTLEAALRFADEHQDYYRYGVIHDVLGVNYRKEGDLDKALKHHKDAQNFHLAVHNKMGAAHAFLNSGNTLVAKKDFTHARDDLQKALELYEDEHAAAHAANVRAELAQVAWQEGDSAAAEQLCSEALQYLDNERQIGQMLLLKGRVLEERADLNGALEAYESGLQLLDNSTDPDAIEACFSLGNLLVRLGRAEEASTYLARAAATYRNMRR